MIRCNFAQKQVLKNRIILIVSAVLLVVVGGILYYFLGRQSPPLTAWTYVPDNALAVYETAQPLERWPQLTESSLGAIIRTLPEVEQFSQQLAYLDSLPSVRSLLQDKTLLIAWQAVGSDALDATFFLSVPKGEARKLSQALDEISRDRLRAEERQYLGYTIHELPGSDGRTFSYVLHQGVFAGSFTPVLVEDVVRNIAGEFTANSFVVQNQRLFDLPKLANDEGNLYLNARRLSSLLSVFVESGTEFSTEPLDALCQSMLLDVSLGEQQLLLNGFSEATLSDTPSAAPAPSSYLQTLADQPARSIGLGDYIPNRTAWLYYLSFGDAEQWQRALFAYQRGHSATYRSLIEQRPAFQEQYSTDLSDWSGWFGQEVALLTLESIDVNAPDRALVIEVADTARANRALRTLSERLAPAAEAEPYREQFSDYSIGELAYAEFPPLLFGPMAKGYKQCFYLLTDQYLIMANSVRVLKRLIIDQEAENTWSKSLKQSRFLESTLDDANLSLVVDVAYSWDLLLPRLSPRWQEIATQHATEWKQVEKVAIQFSENDENFYTSVAINYPEKLEPLAGSSFTTAAQLLVDQPLRTKPYVVRNHNTQAREVLFQDQDHTLRLVSSEQEILWKDSLGVPITSDVYQVDFYNNGKLQYLFASDSALHLIDRTGEPVAGYPLYLPAGVRVQYLSVIDYDNSKKYRFLVSDAGGGLWMFNTDREMLEGWNPNGIASIPAAPPFHVRVRSKDCLIVIGQDGTIYVKNRRGEDYPGFPLRLDQECHSPAFIVPASTFAETTLTTVTDNGELITVNLLGEIMQRVQLYRPSADAYFRLCEDALNKTFVLLRQDRESLGVLDRQGTLLFEKNFFSLDALASGLLEGQYYDFGAGNEVYALTDRTQEFTYLFNRAGELINDRPVESDHAIGLLYSEDQQQFQLYRNFGNEFAILSF